MQFSNRVKFMKKMEGHFSFAIWECKTLIRVEGYATMQNSFVFQNLVENMLQQGCLDFTIDLSLCQGLDSTFMGILVGIVEPSTEKSKISLLTLINIKENHQRSLDNLGISHIFHITKVPIALPKIPMQAIEEVSVSPLSRLKTIQQAHRSLLALPSNHQKEFTEFLEMVEQELQQQIIS
jgi:hypothetical protein